jgi:transposase
MGWKPSKLTREQMEERRLCGGELLREGRLTKAEIARELGVSRAAVSQWTDKIKAEGKAGLKMSLARGQAPKLSDAEQKALKRILSRGAQAAGFPTERWTLARIRKVIEQRFGVRYHLSSVGRLMQSLNMTPQQPMARARERDERLIRAWLSKDWARIKKSAAEAAKHRVC